MEKTTVYLTADQKRALAQAAQAEDRSEARLIREGIDAVTARHRAAEPAARLVESVSSHPVEHGDDRPHRPRWMARDEFVRCILPYQADPGLRTELAELSPDTTDDAEIS